MRIRFPTLLVMLSALNACFMGYDSRWGESKRIQQHNAAAAAPAGLRATAPSEASTADAPHPPAARTYRLRVYATAAYAAQILDWHRRATELIDDANRVLAPSIGAQLAIDGFRDGFVEEQSLSASLNALRKTDDGHDVDWVIGLVGGLPRTTQSFHELGMANILGKHLVVRATSPSQERDAIDRAFYELKEDERAKLARVRARHRATAVLLHEMGHTLGAIHVRDGRSLMHPQYDPRMEAFGDAPIGLMRATLAHRDDADPKELAHALQSALDASDAWGPADREPLESWLRGARAAGDPPPSPSAAPAQEPLPADVAQLPADVRAHFVEASRALAAGDVTAAGKAAGPLFESQRDVLSIQDLRCKIAMARGDDWPSTRAACSRLMELSTSPKK
jgi:hypothetical protein